MARTIEAVYENGVFRPLEPVNLEEGQKVQVHLPSEPETEKPSSDWTEEDWATFEQPWERDE